MLKTLRSVVRISHLWVGLIAGVFICLMGVTGGLLALKPQIAMALAPATPPGPCVPVDWVKAEKEIVAAGHSAINRVYGPGDSDTRYHFRMATDNPILFGHVVYDACSSRVLGTIDYSWMDWVVDLHHNLLSGKTGRKWAGAIGIVLLFSGLSGILLWLVSRPRISTAFAVSLPFSQRTPRELHRAIGLLAALLLAMEALTGTFLAFPQTERAIVAAIAPVGEDVRPKPAKGAKSERPVGLAELMGAASLAIPDGKVREIRMPENGGNAQIRMWRSGDFRFLGNNVVFVSGKTGQVLGVDRYSERPRGNRLIQALAGLHYDEWGGVAFRMIAGIGGLLTPVLFVTGVILWWRSKRPGARRAPAQSM